MLFGANVFNHFFFFDFLEADFTGTGFIFHNSSFEKYLAHDSLAGFSK